MTARHLILPVFFFILFLCLQVSGDPRMGPMGGSRLVTPPGGVNLIRLGDLGTLPFEKKVWLYAGAENKLVFSSSNNRYYAIYLSVENDESTLTGISRIDYKSTSLQGCSRWLHCMAIWPYLHLIAVEYEAKIFRNPHIPYVMGINKVGTITLG